MRYFTIVTLAIFFSAFTGVAQVSDFMVWQGLSIEKKLTKTNSFEVSQSLRINENATIPYKFLIETGWNHRFSKSLKTALVYRFIVKDAFENSQYGHRFYADISLRKKINHWQFGWRIRMQSTYFATASDGGFLTENINRHKLSLTYKRKKLPVSPFAEYEFFVPLGLFPSVPVSENRYGIGISYKINKHQNFSVRYRLMQPLTKNIPQNNYVLGIKWKINL